MVAHLDRIAEYLIAQSWQIAVLVVAVALLSAMLRRRSAHVRYLLWLIVLAKCLVPPALEVSVAVLPPPASAVAAESFLVLAPEATAPAPSIPIDEDPAFDAPAGPAASAPLRLRHWLALIWLAGATFFGLVALTKTASAVRWLRRQRRALPDDMQISVDALLSSLSIRRAPPMWLVEGVGQPFVWGLLRGEIYLPTYFARLEDPQRQRDILGHELSHILRFDAFVNTLQIVAQAVFWFHPFVWWANRKMRQEREKCCDEMAIARFGASVKSYSTATIDTVAQARQSSRPVPSLAVAGSLKQIEERIRAMMTPGRKFYKHPSLVAAMATVLLALPIVPTALVLTARAQTETAAEPQEKPAKSLHKAVADGDLEQVRLHISKGADVNAKDQRGRAPLHRAAYAGHIEVVRLLIERGADVNVEDNLKRTPLEHAAVASHTEVVRLLIEKGGNPNARNQSGATPLHVAAGAAGKDTVQVLIDKGADVTISNAEGTTPLYTAMMSSYRGRRDIVDLIVARGKVPSTIHVAAYVGDLARVKAFTEEGVTVNQKGPGAVTPLHCAAAGGQKEVTEFLLAHGANVHARATDGMTPLHCAVYCSDDVETIKLLIAGGADVNAHASVEGEKGMSVLGLRFTGCVMQSVELADAEGRSDDLMSARVKSLWNSEITRLLTSKGARLGDGDRMWLSIAAAMDMPEVIELAIAQSEDVNAKLPEGSTLLHHAARLGQVKLVEQLLAKGANVDVQDRRGQTPLAIARQQGHTEVANILLKHGAKQTLHAAAAAGDIDEVKRLLSEGSDVNAKDHNGQTPLNLASYRGHKKIVELLIENKADIETRDDTYGDTSLHFAAVSGHKDIVELLIEKGADIEAKNSDGGTPLSLIAGYGAVYIRNPEGQHEIIRLLIDKGANIESRSYWDCTPLYVAITENRREVAELLLKCGAQLNAMSKFWGTPAHGAMRQNLPEIVRWSINKGIDIPPLHQASYFGEIDKVRSLLTGGSDVDQRDIAQFTPLHCAMLGQNAEIAQLLIDKGADIEARNCGDFTVLYYACNLGYLEMVELLMKDGADLHTRGSHRGEFGHGYVDDWTALHIAAHAGHVEVVDYLLAQGADIEANCSRFDDEGLTALHIAAWNGRSDVVKLLLAKGTDVNAKTDKGETPLSLAQAQNHSAVVDLLKQHGAKGVSGTPSLLGAISDGDIEQVKLLISKGADVNAKDQNGQTPLHLAADRGELEMVRLLLAQNADLRAQDNEDFTPLGRAARRRRKEVVELLLAKGADIKNLGTVLHSLAWNGQIDMLDLLLSRGADVEAKNVYQTTPLREAVYNEQYETVKFLIDKGADVYAGGGPILTAVNRNNKKMIELLITKGADISTVMSGETALHSAMQANLPEMVRFLLTKGCETSAINLAAFFGELDRVKELIAKDPNVNARDNCGYTPLYGAICGTHKDVVAFLIDRGANLNVRVPNSKGWTPLMLAVGTQSPDMARLLIVRDAEVNLSAANGNTCLHVAVNRQDRELVGILLDHKANTNAKAGGTCAAWEGWTPFHVACRRGNVPIVEMLLAQGANIHAKTDKGDTPMSLAGKNEHPEVVDLLRKHGAKE